MDTPSLRQKLLEQLVGQLALVLAQGGRVPLGRFHVVDGDKGWLAAHGEAHIAFGQGVLHLLT